MCKAFTYKNENNTILCFSIKIAKRNSFHTPKQYTDTPQSELHMIRVNIVGTLVYRHTSIWTSYDQCQYSGNSRKLKKYMVHSNTDIISIEKCWKCFYKTSSQIDTFINC